MKTKPLTRFICAAFISASAILFAPSFAAAQQETETEKPVLTVSFVKEESGYLIFVVSVSNPGETKGVLKINDKYKQEWHSAIISKDGYCKTYKVPAENADFIEFRYVTGKEVSVKKFEIESKTEIITEVKEIKSKK